MKKARRISMAALTVVVTWLVLYIFNSISGGYSLKPVTTRNPNNNAGIATISTSSGVHSSAGSKMVTPTSQAAYSLR